MNYKPAAEFKALQQRKKEYNLSKMLKEYGPLISNTAWSDHRIPVAF